jgi:hypothetical protein
MRTEARYVREYDLAAAEAEGWSISDFYAWRGGFAVFVMTRDVPGAEVNRPEVPP